MIGLTNTQPDDLKDTDAILIVSVPTGSTVTATKNEMTLTPTIWMQSADNTRDSAIFSIPSNTFDTNAWTVTATLNGDTASNTVVVNGAYKYDIALNYDYHLFYQGVIESDISGGLSTFKISGSNGTYDYQIANEFLYATVTYQSGQMGLSILYRTTNKIDLTGYSTLHMLVEYCKITSSTNLPKMGLCSQNPTGELANNNNWGLVAYTQLQAGSSRVDYTIDITSNQDRYYLMLGIFAGTGGTSQVIINDWWLER